MAHTVFPALSRPRKRILAFLCRRPGISATLSVAQRRREHERTRTKLSEDVPEPVDDEHGKREVESEVTGTRKAERILSLLTWRTNVPRCQALSQDSVGLEHQCTRLLHACYTHPPRSFNDLYDTVVLVMYIMYAKNSKKKINAVVSH